MLKVKILKNIQFFHHQVTKVTAFNSEDAVKGIE